MLGGGSNRKSSTRDEVLVRVVGFEVLTAASMKIGCSAV
jgi:hypothetical protein